MTMMTTREIMTMMTPNAKPCGLLAPQGRSTRTDRDRDRDRDGDIARRVGLRCRQSAPTSALKPA